MFLSVILPNFLPMIHPLTELRYINDEIGYGVFAKGQIPRGTITYVKDSLEIQISPTDFLLFTPQMQEYIEKYSYIDEVGTRIISWDFAKYVNHCCQCNTISTGYGFEIAIRDIQPGEQITDEYGLFNIEQPIPLNCGNVECRRVVRPEDVDVYYQEWDEKVKNALIRLFEVDQPLLPLIDEATRKEVDAFFADPGAYRSVYHLKYRPHKSN